MAKPKPAVEKAEKEERTYVRAEDVHGLRFDVPTLVLLHNELAAEIAAKSAEKDQLREKIQALMEQSGVGGCTVGDEGEQTKIAYTPANPAATKSLSIPKLVQAGVTQAQIDKATEWKPKKAYITITPPKAAKEE